MNDDLPEWRRRETRITLSDFQENAAERAATLENMSHLDGDIVVTDADDTALFVVMSVRSHRLLQRERLEAGGAFDRCKAILHKLAGEHGVDLKNWNPED